MREDRGDLFGVAETLLPAISMWQPWASLVFETEPAFRKGHETRGGPYPAKYHGRRIAIQAAAISPTSRRVADQITEDLDDLCIRAFGSHWRLTLPRGCVLGTVVLGGCYPSHDLIEHIGFADRVAGIWGGNRWGWQLDSVARLATPIPAKGAQGWFRVPAAALATPPHQTPPKGDDQ